MIKLRQHESRIPFSDYGNDKFKPFFGVLFVIDDLSYITQVSFPKQRHHNMTNQKDFKKVYTDKRRLLCVVNLNYMFPVPTDLIENIQYGNIEQYRTFNNDAEKAKYITILRKELTAISAMNLAHAAKTLYDLKNNSPEDTISKRCLNFKELEKIARTIEK